MPPDLFIVSIPICLEVIDGINDLLRLVRMVFQRPVNVDIRPRTFLAKASLGLDVLNVVRRASAFYCTLDKQTEEDKDQMTYPCDTLLA